MSVSYSADVLWQLGTTTIGGFLRCTVLILNFGTYSVAFSSALCGLLRIHREHECWLLAMCVRRASVSLLTSHVQVLHHPDTVPSPDHEWCPRWSSWDGKDRNHQGSREGPGHDGVCVQLLRTNGLQSKIGLHEALFSSV